MRMRHSTILIICVGVLALGMVAVFAIGFRLPLRAVGDTAGSGVESFINEYIPVTPGTRIEIDNAAGSVRVEPTGNDTVHVSGRLGENVLPLVVENGDGFIRIMTVRGKLGRIRINTGRRNGAELLVKVPLGHPLRINTVSADQYVQGYVASRIECESVSGTIHCGSVSDKAVITTVSGDIIRSGKAKAVKVATVSGDINVYNETDGNYRINSTSGDLVLHGGLLDDGSLDVESISGDAALWLPESISARFDLGSMSGNISNDVPCTGELRKTASTEKRFEGVAGSGNGEVSIRTQSGDITVKRLVLKKPGV